MNAYQYEYMVAVKVQYAGSTSLVQLYYDGSSSYPGWYARYRRKGKSRKTALSVWDAADFDGALAEAVRLFGCSTDRIEFYTN